MNLDYFLRTRLKLYATVFAAVVLLDLIVFSVTQRQVIIDWHSLLHAGWASIATILLLFWAFIRKKWIGYVGLLLHFAVFLVVTLNQFLHFTVYFNYYCLLFNLAMFNIYYFSIE